MQQSISSIGFLILQIRNFSGSNKKKGWCNFENLNCNTDFSLVVGIKLALIIETCSLMQLMYEEITTKGKKYSNYVMHAKSNDMSRTHDIETLEKTVKIVDRTGHCKIF